MTNKWNGAPRGFAFVTYRDPSVVPRVLAATHKLDGRTVEVKRAIPREDTRGDRGGYGGGMGMGGGQMGMQGGYGGGGGGNHHGGSRADRRKIYIGSLPPTATDADLRQYFERYGPILDACVLSDRDAVTGGR
jgi:RNA recognition motif-containing protein